jgi:hypothetical protein
LSQDHRARFFAVFFGLFLRTFDLAGIEAFGLVLPFAGFALGLVDFEAAALAMAGLGRADFAFGFALERDAFATTGFGRAALTFAFGLLFALVGLGFGFTLRGGAAAA